VSAVPASPVDHRAETEDLRERVAQLQSALDSRIVIEQAKGVLMERFTLTPEAAFQLLRRAARNDRESIHKLAALVTASSTTPVSIEKVRRAS
jgi:AmiR/NasT family two-component response regulator